VALPTTISADREFVDNMNFGGPFQIGGKTYVVVGDINAASAADSFIYVYGATDPTSSFTLEDSSNEDNFHTIVSFWAVEHDSDIYIYTISSDPGGSDVPSLKYAIFDPGTDAFTTELTAITDTVDDLSFDNLFVSAAIRSDGDQIVLYSGDSIKYMGVDRPAIDYVREEGSGWSSAIAVAEGAAAAIVYRYGLVIPTESDKMQFLYWEAGGQEVEVRNLNSSNTLSSVDTATDTDLLDNKRMFGGGAYYLDGAVDKARASIWSVGLAAGNELEEVYIDDDVVNSAFQNIGWEDSTVITDDVQKHWMSEVMVGKKRYIMYIDDGNDINYTSIDDDGTPAADVEAIALTDVNGIFCRVINRKQYFDGFLFNFEAGGSDPSFSFTNNGDFLVISSMARHASAARTINGIQYNSSALTVLQNTTQGNVRDVETSYHASPATGANTVAVDIDDPTGVTAITSVIAVDNVTAVDVSSENNGNGTDASGTITTTKANCFLIAIVHSDGTVGSGVLEQPEWARLTPESSFQHVYIREVFETGTYAFDVNGITSDDWVVHMVALEVAAPTLRLAYVYDDAGTIKYNEVDIAVSGDQTLTPSLVGSMVVIHAPVVTTGSVTLTPSLVGSMVAIHAPQVNLEIAPSLVNGMVAIHVPTITVGAVTLSVPLISGMVAIHEPVITTGPVTITAPLVASMVAIHAPVITTSYSLTPSLLSTLVTIHVPIVTVGSVTLTPTLVGSMVAIYAPQVNLGIFPSLVSPTVNIYAPTVTTGSVTLTPSLVGSMVVIYAPQIDLKIFPSLVGSMVTIHAPTVALDAGDQTLTPSLVSVTVTVYAPQVDLNIFPSLVGSIVAIHAPVVTVGSVTLTPSLVGSMVTIYAPQVDLNIFPSLVSPTVTIYAPTVTVGSVTLTPSLVGSMVTIHSPVVTTGAVTLTPSLVGSMVAVYAPQVDLEIFPSLVGSIVTIHSPVVTVGSVTLTPSLVGSMVVIHVPVVTQTAITLTPSLIGSMVVIYAPVVTTGSVTLTPSLVGSMVAIYAPQIDLKIFPSLVGSMAVVHAPAVTTGSVTLTPSLVSITVNIFAPTVTTGSVTLTPSLLSGMVAIYAPTVTTLTTLTPTLVGSMVAIYAPVVTTGAVTLTPSLLSSLVVIYAPGLQYDQTLTPALVSPTVTIYAPVVSQLWVNVDDIVGPSWSDAEICVEPSYSDADSPTTPSYSDAEVCVTPSYSDVDAPVSTTWVDARGEVGVPLISVTVNIFAPTLTTTVTLTPSLIGSMAVVHVPVVTTLTTLTPGLVSTTVNIYAPVITVGTVTLTPSLVSSMVTIYAPNVKNNQTLTVPLLTGLIAIHVPTVKYDQTLTVPLISPTVTIYASAVGTLLVPSLVSPTVTIYVPTVTTQTTLTPSLVGSMAAIYAPVVTTLTTLTPGIVSPTVTIHAATIFNAITVGQVTNFAATPADPQAISHDNDTNDFLLVLAAAEDNSDGIVAPITYNAVNMTIVDSATTQDRLQDVSIYYKTSPATEVNDVSVDVDAGIPNNLTVTAMSFNDVHQTTPILATVTQAKLGSDPSESLTTTGTNSVIVAMMVWENGNAVTEDSGNGWVEHANISVGALRMLVHTLQAPTAGTYTVSYDTLGADDLVIKMVELQIV